MPIKKASGSGQPDYASVDASGSNLAVAHPSLWEYLTLTKFEDGSSRTPATLLLLVEDGKVKGMLNDKAEGRVAWRSAATIELLFLAFEEGLTMEDLDWRKQKEWKPRR